MKRNRDAFVDAAFEFSAVRNQRLESLATECIADLGQVRELERSRLLEFGHEVTEQLQVGVVVLLDAFHHSADGRGTASSPVGGLQGNDDIIRSAESSIAGQRDAWRTVEQDLVVAREQIH